MDPKVKQAVDQLKTLADAMGSKPMKDNLKIIETALLSQPVPTDNTAAMRDLDEAKAKIESAIKGLKGGKAASPNSKSRPGKTGDGQQSAGKPAVAAGAR